MIKYMITKLFGYGAKKYSPIWAYGGHFPKWPPALYSNSYNYIPIADRNAIFVPTPMFAGQLNHIKQFVIP